MFEFLEILKNYPYSRKYKKVSLNSITGMEVNRIKKIGGFFVCNSNESCRKTNDFVFSLTPLHGRSAVYYTEEGSCISIKGSGWTYGGAVTVCSPKDPELYFGLMGQKEAQRELEVSAILDKQKIRAGRVLGFGCLNNKETFPELGDIEVCYKNGNSVHPALLFTETITPIRVADLAYLREEDRFIAVRESSVRAEWGEMNPSQYFEKFAIELTSTVSDLHALGGVADTLFFDNVTLAAELVDLEWLWVPGVPLPDGTEDVQLEERQAKAGIYLAEICYLLCCHLWIKKSLNQIASILLESGENLGMPTRKAIESLI